MRPYLISLALFILVIVQELYHLYMKEAYYAGDKERYYFALYIADQTLASINEAFTLIKIDLVIFFILIRTYEME